MQLLACLLDARVVIRINDEDQGLRAGEVVAPERTDLVLAAHIPDIELDILVGHGLDVEANGGDGRDVLVQLELVENGWEQSRVSCQSESGCRGSTQQGRSLVLPAASRPSMRRRISFDPKTLPINLDTWPPMIIVVNVV